MSASARVIAFYNQRIVCSHGPLEQGFWLKSKLRAVRLLHHTASDPERLAARMLAILTTPVRHQRAA
jgi:hypothetical protein